MIEMKDVYKRYPNGVTAASGIDIHIKQGEFVYVVGPSGAGKSTFIKMMYREEKPSSGTITIDGVNLATLKNAKVPLMRRKIGVVFQDAGERDRQRHVLGRRESIVGGQWWIGNRVHLNGDSGRQQRIERPVADLVGEGIGPVVVGRWRVDKRAVGI